MTTTTMQPLGATTSRSRVPGALRVLAGLLFAAHGLQKLLLGFLGTLPPEASAAAVCAAGLVELAGGVLLARDGWRVRPATTPRPA
jgi:uncharacterized membrane protein YphA (DoxX/SURF4 family)